MRRRSSFVASLSLLAVSFGLFTTPVVLAETYSGATALDGGASRVARPAALGSQRTLHPTLNKNEPAYSARAPLGGSPIAAGSAPARRNMSRLSAIPSTATPTWSPTAAYESLSPSYGPARTPKHTATSNVAHKKSTSKKTAASHRKNANLSDATKSTSAKKQKSATKGSTTKSKSSAASTPKNRASKKNAMATKPSSTKESSTASKKHAATVRKRFSEQSRDRKEAVLLNPKHEMNRTNRTVP